MTKHERIVAFLEKKLTPKEIAKRIGCDPAYVRAVKAREFGNGRDTGRNYQNKRRLFDEAWLAKERRRKRNYMRRRYAAARRAAERAPREGVNT